MIFHGFDFTLFHEPVKCRLHLVFRAGGAVVPDAVQRARKRNAHAAFDFFKQKAFDWEGDADMPLYIRNCNVIKTKCDAVIDASDENLSGVCGVDRAIKKAAGPLLEKECAEIGHCDVGSAVITKGYDLCKYVIHIAPPVWIDGKHGEKKLLASCYRKALELARDHGCRSVAMTIVSGRRYGFMPNDNLQIAVETANQFLERCNMEIILAAYRNSTYNLVSHMFSEVTTPVQNSAGDRKLQIAGISPYQCMELDALLKRDSESFADMLLRKISEKGMTNSECYRKALTTKSVFSDIRTKPDYMPKKETVTGFVFALKLPIEEALEMYAAAGYYLSRNRKFDVIVEYFIENGKYDLFELNDTLMDYDLKCVGSY